MKFEYKILNNLIIPIFLNINYLLLASSNITTSTDASSIKSTPGYTKDTEIYINDDNSYKGDVNANIGKTENPKVNEQNKFFKYFVYPPLNHLD